MPPQKLGRRLSAGRSSSPSRAENGNLPLLLVGDLFTFKNCKGMLNTKTHSVSDRPPSSVADRIAPYRRGQLACNA